MKFHGPFFKDIKANVFWVDVKFSGYPDRINFNARGEPTLLSGDFVKRLLVEFEIVDNKPTVTHCHWENAIKTIGRGTFGFRTRCDQLNDEMTVQVNKVLNDSFKRGLIG